MRGKRACFLAVWRVTLHTLLYDSASKAREAYRRAVPHGRVDESAQGLGLAATAAVCGASVQAEGGRVSTQRWTRALVGVAQESQKLRNLNMHQ